MNEKKKKKKDGGKRNGLQYILIRRSSLLIK